MAISGDPLPATEDLLAWVAAVAPLRLTDRLIDLYVRGDDVAGAVKTSKRRGELQDRAAVRRPVWHARIGYGQIRSAHPLEFLAPAFCSLASQQQLELWQQVFLHQRFDISRCVPTQAEICP